MCKEDIKSFVFVGQIITKDQELNDQNVYQFHFKNIGTTPVILNNTIYLKPATDSFVDEYIESIGENEKTETIYRIRFLGNTVGKTKNLLVVQKIPAKKRG